MRDLSSQQFLEFLRENCMELREAGYVDIGISGIQVYRFHGGYTYRAQAAWLLQTKDEIFESEMERVAEIYAALAYEDEAAA